MVLSQCVQVQVQTKGRRVYIPGHLEAGLGRLRWMRPGWTVAERQKETENELIQVKSG